MMTDLAPPQIRGMTGLELAAGMFAKCSDQLATQLKISLTSGTKDAGPLPLSIGINGDVYGGMRAPLEVGMRRVDIAYVNPSAMVAMAYRGKGYYKQKMELRVLGCFPSWDRIALVVSKDLGIKSIARHRSAQNSAACFDAFSGVDNGTYFTIATILGFYGFSFDRSRNGAGGSRNAAGRLLKSG